LKIKLRLHEKIKKGLKTCDGPCPFPHSIPIKPVAWILLIFSLTLIKPNKNHIPNEMAPDPIFAHLRIQYEGLVCEKNIIAIHHNL
jgi:hypothetical protein